jgi:hypothetical protein
MLIGYFDESGYHHNPKEDEINPFGWKKDQLIQLTLGGSIAEFKVWQNFEVEWKKFLDKEKIKCFHMVDFQNYVGEFKHYDKAKNHEVWNEAVSIIRNHFIHHFVVTIYLYEGKRPEDEKKAIIQMYENGLVDIIHHAGEHAIALGDDIDLVFAIHDDYPEGRIREHFGDFRVGNSAFKAVTSGFPIDIIPLQVADIVAYEASCFHRFEEQQQGAKVKKRDRYTMRKLSEPLENGFGSFQVVEWRMSPTTYSRKFPTKLDNET